ncbi:hypothetical protein CPC735_072320 [Coccidioides posadasii C735 delta SOWgp]|uniref:Uncharacterized protein n=2 Tax=Coccidioides posadasii TaxID=199306 RepID=A0A0J6FKS6_COCPO|nr:hypothetical protein CPC735_072320 [Coccidioides posadasii C735 delta SOWgp]EER29550.1 hypothetical protein CPC735_072320 [Coccidioides posadasii C735 delta SOWgp]KMM70040.1 hypothetical protein CPAG_06352 [Coccidioides posadasii RMSCC 3488]|eukprot:XP_003071695.1 hypothetical protein CPC735_072320 [Coccidioides posadasii C735 delta SOWgp]
MAGIKPNPLSWTLRFKNHNVTILLLVSPAEPFDSIKKTLLKALKERGIDEINGVQVPEDPSGIELGLPVDRNNLEKGWVLLQVPTERKGVKRDAAGIKKSVVSDSPQGADLRDSQAVAFRFRATKDESQTENGLEMEIDDAGWDVLIPTYADEDEEEGEGLDEDEGEREGEDDDEQDD